MKSFVTISVLAATAAMAQSSSSSAAAPASTTNPYIPSGISSGCTSFLIALNSNAALSSCTAPLIKATANFGPGASSTAPPSGSDINSAFSSVCGNTACSIEGVRGTLSSFYSACTAELTSNLNTDVIRTYDVLYSLIPFTQALCTKDGNGAYCATEATSSSSSGVNNNVDVVVASGSSTVSSLKQFLWSTTSGSVAKRTTAETAAIIPNITTYRDSNLLFFFLQPDTPSATLCTTCSRSVMLAFMQFEASVPYGPGLSNSVLMSGQNALYTAMNSTCGASFFTGGVSAVGGIASGMLGGSETSAAPRIIGQGAGIMALLAGTVAFAGFML